MPCALTAAIEEVVVPAATRIYERRRQQLGLDTLRPWDLDVDTFGRPPLRPFSDVDELITGSSNIFHLVHPQLGAHFDTMVMEGCWTLKIVKTKRRAPTAPRSTRSAARSSSPMRSGCTMTYKPCCTKQVMHSMSLNQLTCRMQPN
jgi:hypothetical protein